MADTSVLDRRTASIDEAEREHKELISDNYRRYFGDREERTQNNYNSTPANSNAAPAYRETVGYYGSATAEKYQSAYREARNATVDPRTSALPSVPSAAQRLADYVPISVGMTKLQRIGDMPSYQAQKVVNYAPVAEPEVAEPKQAPARQQLFDGLTYRDGTLINEYAPVAESAVKPEVAPEPVRTPEYDPSYMPSEDDALPTRRTLESIRPIQQKDESVGFFASLSAKTKIVLAVVATVLVLMIALVCINTAVINSLNADIESRQAQITRLAETSGEIKTEIAEITDPENIAAWAQAHGMTSGN